MGRPKLKEQRAAQILDAYEVCVARFGLEGATLEKVAEQAGLARALIRHNIGNREDLEAALIDRFFKYSDASNKYLLEQMPTEDAASFLVDFLFTDRFGNDDYLLVSEALIAASNTRPALAQRMKKWLSDFNAAIEKIVRSTYPDADRAHLKAVAIGITGIYFNMESMSPIGTVRGLRPASKRAAQLLLESLSN
ncbi:MAG: TetR/AcrR family transcriptional regulator [Pseudomonadota bacterium]|nr:TetR/AcrR family transcriptional regulator [Pseudomonadota bacterium]